MKDSGNTFSMAMLFNKDIKATYKLDKLDAKNKKQRISKKSLLLFELNSPYWKRIHKIISRGARAKKTKYIYKTGNMFLLSWFPKLINKDM